MRNTLSLQKLSIILPLFLLIMSAVSAQDMKEGKATFQITYTDLPAQLKEMPGVESMLPSEVLMFFKGAMSRTEMNTMGTGPVITIYDGKTNSGTLLLDVLGTKYAMEQKSEDGKEPKVEVVNTQEKKTINGYECVKSILKVKDEDSGETVDLEVWHTSKLSSGHMYSKHIKGFPLDYQVRNQGMTMRMTVKELKDEKVSDKLFKVPDEYKKVTQEELMKALGGQ